ncbi:GL18822 [Drosophila persimilis]|uniref:GL18822 n=1 Tax=Drosophila persimilis TaxID=7234 RepID=B4G8K1_DROPE|nr:GL18822 [Drosophila persimilis]
MNNFIEPSAASPSIGDAGRITMQNISSSSDQFLVPNFEKRSSIAATHLPLPLQHFFPVSPVVPPSVVTAVGPDVDSPQPSRSRMAQMEIYWNGIASVNNKMTMDITKTEPGLVGLSSNQQQQHSRQQQQAASMNSNSGNNVGQNTNNGCNSNGGGVNSGNNNSLSNVQSIAAAANNNNNNNNGSLLCAGCGKHIKDRYFLRALDMLWHQDCLKCGCCDCRLGEVGSTLYKTGNLILCKLDYFRLFGNTGYCAACSKVISAFEMVMRAHTNVYHFDCFACQQCNHRLCVGDRFYLCKNKILCEYDYEEWLLFATIAAGVPDAARADCPRRKDQAEAQTWVVVVGISQLVRGTPGRAHNNNQGTPDAHRRAGSPFAGRGHCCC